MKQKFESIRQKYILLKVEKLYKERSEYLNSKIKDVSNEQAQIEIKLNEEIDKYNGNLNSKVIQQILALNQSDLQKLMHYRFSSAFQLGLNVENNNDFIDNLKDLSIQLQQKKLELKESFELLEENERIIKNKLRYKSLVKERDALKFIANLKKLKQFGEQ